MKRIINVLLCVSAVFLLNFQAQAQTEKIPASETMTEEQLKVVSEEIKKMPVRNKIELREKLERKFSLMGFDVGTISDIPVAGFYEVSLGDEYLYVSRDGQWIVRGDIIDINNDYSLTQRREHKRAIKNVEYFGDENIITYKANNEIGIIYVYTDTSCGFCQKLHADKDTLLDAGITIKYLPFPRGGKDGPGYNDMVNVWCSDDRQSALTIAKNGGANLGVLEKSKEEIKECGNIVISGYQYGNRSGVTGTPRIYTSNGYIIPGYPGESQIIGVLNRK